MRGSILAAPAALAMLLCTHGAAADTPRKVAVGPGSPKGALLFKIPALPIGYRLFFIRAEELGTRAQGHSVFIKETKSGEGERFVVESLKPGRYLLGSVHRQAKWIACLETRTFLVTVEPGKIAYLGTLDVRPTLDSIQRNAAARKQLSAQTFQWHFYRTDIAAPRLSDRDTAGLAQAASFVRQNMPKSIAAPSLAPLQWSTYPGVKTSGGADRCD
ncbi:MAG TPA: hypothetical protein VIA98_03770 [Allosphingosinicella sp.]|jgi:hypothetical protein